jgi:hypothetical protein
MFGQQLRTLYLPVVVTVLPENILRNTNSAYRLSSSENRDV